VIGMSEIVEMTESARAAADAIQQLCRATLSRPAMTPAEVDVVLGHLAAAAAALPQTARQLGDILEQAADHYMLQMDALTETVDPGLAIETARLHLDALNEPALEVHCNLAAARHETAHISSVATPGRAMRGVPHHNTPLVPRPEDRPPPTGAGGPGPGLPR
jgi:hypothetical protein